LYFISALVIAEAEDTGTKTKYRRCGLNSNARSWRFFIFISFYQRKKKIEIKKDLVLDPETHFFVRVK